MMGSILVCGNRRLWPSMVIVIIRIFHIMCMAGNGRPKDLGVYTFLSTFNNLPLRITSPFPFESNMLR